MQTTEAAAKPEAHRQLLQSSYYRYRDPETGKNTGHHVHIYHQDGVIYKTTQTGKFTRKMNELPGGTPVDIGLVLPPCDPGWLVYAYSPLPAETIRKYDAPHAKYPPYMWFAREPSVIASAFLHEIRVCEQIRQRLATQPDDASSNSSLCTYLGVTVTGTDRGRVAWINLERLDATIDDDIKFKRPIDWDRVLVDILLRN